MRCTSCTCRSSGGACAAPWISHRSSTSQSLSGSRRQFTACMRSRLTGGCGVPCETQRASPLLHRLNAEVDVFLERNAQFLRAFDDVLAIHAARKCLVLHLLLYGRHVHL